MKHDIGSVKEMTQLALGLAEQVKPGDVLLLSGNLGTGKTTFVQKLAQQLGVHEVVTSPTFTIMGEYEVTARKDIQWLVHIDLYRVTANERENVDAEYITEVIDSALEYKRLVAVEWPERLEIKWPKRSWRLEFQYGDKESERIVTVQEPS